MRAYSLLIQVEKLKQSTDIYEILKQYSRNFINYGFVRVGNGYSCGFDFIVLSDIGPERLREELSSRFKAISVEADFLLEPVSLGKLAKEHEDSKKRYEDSKR